MKKQIIEHTLSIVFIAAIFATLFILFSPAETITQIPENYRLPEKLRIDIIDINNSLDKALLKETLYIFYDSNTADSLFQLYEFESYNDLAFSKSSTKPDITTEKLTQILIMFIKFVFVYLLVLGLTYYGVQTLAVFRFVGGKQNKPPLIFRAFDTLKKLNQSPSFVEGLKIFLLSFFYLAKAFIKIIFYLILFSPAYVIAYSFKTKFDTDSIIFMIFLGVISNALLITYSQKFYTFLISESNKGYVETALVKNLNNDYSFKSILPSLIFRVKKFFPGHVFNHIFINAQHQYYSTIKEQAAYLVTGLIIIEMALNIQGHLGYELMQNLLYQKYRLVLIAIFLIYLTVKATEIFVDIFIFKENKKYYN